YNGDVVKGKFCSQLSKKLNLYSQQQAGTLFMGLLTLVKALLYRYTNQEDIIIGCPIAGREHAELTDQIGFYVNTLLLRTRFKGSDNYISLFENIKGVTKNAYEHQSYPFDELVTDLSLNRDLSRNVLFDVAVLLQSNETRMRLSEHELPGLKVNVYQDYKEGTSKFDLLFYFIEAGDEIQYLLEYNTDLYERSSIVQLSNHLDSLLKAVLKYPETSIDRLEFLSDTELHQQMKTHLVGRSLNIQVKKTIIDLFYQFCPEPETVVKTYELSKEFLESGNQTLLNSVIDGSEVYVLNEKQRFCPIGVKGEIYIGGECLSPKHMESNLLAQERLIKNPYKIGEMLYRTGDWGYWSKRSSLIYAGIKDLSIKTENYKIQPLAVENIIREYFDIEDVIAFNREEKDREKILTVYFIGKPGLTIATLKDYLNRKLPLDMHPDYLGQIERFPLNADGKINVDKLINIFQTNGNESNGKDVQTEIVRKKISSLWHVVLNRNQIGIHDNFFELNGSSSQLDLLLLQINEEYKIDLDIKYAFANATIY
ncbi:MAG: hypothetical protein EOO43_14600, partial [Flavobacterium sp.]